MINSSSTGFDSGGASYGFDANGNVSGTSDSVGDGNTQLAANGYTYQYDADGNMTQQTAPDGFVTTYAWDNRGRMTSATTTSSAYPGEEWLTTYTYDTFNNLIGDTTEYLWDGGLDTRVAQRFIVDTSTGQAQLAFDYDGNLTDRFLWGPLVDEVLADEKVTSLSSAGTVEWMAHGVEGSVTGVWVSGSSALADDIQYNAFGGIASQTDGGNAPLFGYDGEFTDPNTGMQYHNEPGNPASGRWYLPWEQRWASQDPTFPLSGSNPFEAFDNSPTNFIDPSGLADVPAAITEAAAAGDLELASTLIEGLGPNASPTTIRTVLSAIVKKFPPASGQCYQAAAKMVRVFKAVGQSPQIVKVVSSRGGNFLAWAGVQFATRGDHEAVLVDGTIYDSLVGAGGVSIAEYTAAWVQNVGVAPLITNAANGAVIK